MNAEMANSLHNMSAPPRSQIQVAPNRQPGRAVRVWVPNISLLLHNPNSWEEQVLSFAQCEDWSTLIQQSTNALNNVSSLPPFFVMGGSKLQPTHSIEPLLVVAILARTAKNLCMLNAQPMYTFERLRQSRIINDPRVLDQLALSRI